MKTVAKENLYQLNDLLQKISTKNYTNKLNILSGASIGQHLRHTLEFYLLLLSRIPSATISYDKRERDIRIETDPEFAIASIQRILADLESFDENSQLQLEADYTVNGASQNLIPSSGARELAYCIEHSIHHQALIKAGLLSLGLEDLTDEYFGLAYSTIRYRNSSCAQ